MRVFADGCAVEESTGCQARNWKKSGAAVLGGEEDGMTGELVAESAAIRTLPGKRVYAMAAIYLLVGLAIGYLVRGGQSAAPSTHAVAIAAPTPLHPGQMGGGHMHTPQQLKQLADKQAAPLMEKLKSNPNDSATLMQVGALFYTTGQYKEASAYYERALQTEPANVANRVKLATSLFRGGDADGAIAQLNQALTYDPKDANALFDLGMMKLQGKQDSKGALAAWHKLLKSNPQLSEGRRAQVEQLMASVASGNSQAKEGAPGK